ncbi:hypothetical protein EV201_3366 [Ancylomarina subtilis]|uniref:Uncharacterized protein n=1 Tax=Ancylomarina subtilis TaxID=1639035 RepID=A0A4Q7V3M1_9BACT|nr:hypothetical protein [Ancylomarina subtilis]RZT91026.1 hypothetical protein EV201_3366 [Ancylomarina subtilis]
MNFRKDLETSLFYFGFRVCKKRKNLNFLKLDENNFLLIQIFERGETADLIHAKFHSEDDPCNSEPYWEESLKLGFTPESDSQILRNFIKEYENKKNTVANTRYIP